MLGLSIVAIGWSTVLAVVTAWAARRTRGRPVRTIRDAAPWPREEDAELGSVLLLRPCAGTEPHLGRALRSSRCVGPRVRTRFLVAQSTDEAMLEAARVASELGAAGRDVRVVVTGASAPNMKAAQLARALELDALEGGRADVVVVADSDVELTGEALAALFGPLASGEADASWVPPVETCPTTPADRASASVLDASLHAFPLLVGLDRNGMVGKLFALRRHALDATGGFATLVDHLGEDVELSRRFRQGGLRVHACPSVVGSLASGRSWGDVVRRYARWVAVVRAQRTPLLASYPLLFAATPLILVLAVAGLAFDGASGSEAIGFVLAVRFGIAVVARRRAGRPVRPARALCDGLVADGVLLVAFARAIGRRDVVWRGARLALVSKGLLERVR